MPLRVAVSFCGGCDPAYDRTQYYQAIQAAAGDRIVWVRLNEGGHDAVLLICGCATACPLEETAGEPRPMVLTDDGLPPREVVTELIRKGTEDGDQDKG